MPLIQPVVLWSDALIFFLVIVLISLFVCLKTNPQTQKNWLKVFQSRIGMASFLVMAMYVLIALLDSLHFREALPSTDHSDLVSPSDISNPSKLSSHQHKPKPETVFFSNDVKSVLDSLLGEMKTHQEKTYSAPFSLYSFAKENMEDEQGRMYRDFPRLKFGGVHLSLEDGRMDDVLSQSFHALGVALCFSSLLIGLIAVLRRRWLPDSLPWTLIYSLLIIMSIIVVWIVELGGDYHILGTDKVGTDVLYQSIKSIRTGVLLGTLATVLALPFAIVFGISAGYFKGWIDDVVQYLYTTLSSIPDILLIAAAVLIIDVYIETHTEQFELLLQRGDFKFLALCLIFGLTSWTGLCRLLRAETLKVSQLDYVEAARAFGVKHSAIIFRHILPNVMHLVIISLVLNFSSFVMAESILAYIGVGIDPSMNSWGNMINEARQELSRDPVVWWSITSAFILMFMLVLAANLFSDKVRDAFDPRVLSRVDSKVGKR